MKRTELLALADACERGEIWATQLAAINLRQIAETRPQAWGATDGSGWCVANRRIEANPQEKESFSIPLYTLPLED